MENTKETGLQYIAPYRTEYDKVTQESVKTLLESWKVFCTLPLEVKNAIGFTNAGGYEHKLRSKKEATETTDDKENFHISTRGFATLKKHAEENNIQEMLALCNAADNVFNTIQSLSDEYLAEVEKVAPSLFPKSDMASARDAVTLRLLHYYKGSMPEAIIAHPHIDRGTFTLHLAETDEGVEYLSESGEWLSVPVSDTQTVLFGGALMQVYTQGAVKGLCHRVRATESAAKEGRYAIVAFIDAPGYVYKKEEFGPMSGHKPGFNYKLNDAEFRKFFEESDTLLNDAV